MYDITEIPFQQVIEALLDTDKPVNPRYLYRLSDLEDHELEALSSNWESIPERRRLALMEDVESLGEANYILSFEALCQLALKDKHPYVRILALRILDKYEVHKLIPTFLELLEKDSHPEVRAASANTLSRYIYFGEIETLPTTKLSEIVDRLLSVYKSSDTTLVKRSVLEALGYSERPEIAPMIEAAYYSGKNDWIASALFAMARSANDQWEPYVLEMLHSEHTEVRKEAAHAAGELELTKSVPVLINLLDDHDLDVRMAAVWALSQIGGEGVRDSLELLFEGCEDEDEADFIDRALDNLSFTEDLQLFSLLEVNEEETNPLNHENDYDALLNMNEDQS